MNPAKTRTTSLIALYLFATVAISHNALAQDPPLPNPVPRDGFGRSRVEAPAPSSILIPAGAWLSIRTNQPLSTKRSQVGDTFTATLTQPLVADGLVLARRGQLVSGRVVESERAGRVKGSSRLGLELTELSLVDGQQIAIRTQLVETRGASSAGRDVGAVAATTGTGAAIGAAAAGGSGAGLGAIAGAGAAIIGVLATRGRDTEIYPEEVISFRTLAPINISTDRSGPAFQTVQQDDFAAPRQLQPRSTRYAPSPYFVGGLISPFSPFYWGPGFFGPGFGYFSPRFYNRGFIRRR